MENIIFKILEKVYNLGIKYIEDLETIYNQGKVDNVNIMKTFKEWNDIGYVIKKGEKGTKLYLNSNTKYTYFDISQVKKNKEETVPIIKPIINNISKYLDEYEAQIEREIDKSFNEEDKAIIKEVVKYSILDKNEYYDEKEKEEKQEYIIKLLETRTNEEKIRIIKESAKVLYKTIVEINKKAKKENMVVKKELDIDKILYYTINQEKSQYNNKEVNYGDRVNERRESENYEGSGRVFGDIEQSVFNRQFMGTGRGDGKTAEDNMADGGQGLDNREYRGIYKESESVSEESVVVSKTTQGSSRSNSRGIYWKQHNRRDERDRHLGAENEKREEVETNNRRDISRISENPLQNDNREEYAEDRRDIRGKEPRSGRIDKGEGRTNKQLEETTYIPGTLQEQDIRRVAEEDRRYNGDNEREVSKRNDKVDGQDKRSIQGTETIANRRYNANGSMTRIDNLIKNIDETKDVIEVNLNNREKELESLKNAVKLKWDKDKELSSMKQELELLQIKSKSVN